jgi:hypothetical protein
MATIGQTGSARTTRELIDHWVPLAVAGVVAIWALLELGGLLLANHTIGAELYGLIVALLAVVAGFASVWLLLGRRRHTFATWAVLLLWGLIALGGLAGTAAHAIAPDPAHGPVDYRPRPPGAPLVFTFLGVVGGGALFYGQRRAPAVNEGR